MSDGGQGIGAVIGGIREALGLSRQELSAATAEAPRGKTVKERTIERIEAGEKKPSVRALASLAHALGLENPELEAAGDRLFAATGGQSPRKQIQALAMASSGISAGGALGMAPGVGVVDSAAAMTSIKQQNRAYRELVERQLRTRLATLETGGEVGDPMTAEETEPAPDDATPVGTEDGRTAD